MHRKVPQFLILVSLLFLVPSPAFPWGSLYPGETHQYIISTAYNRLKADPAFATHLFPTFSAIKGHEGVQWTANGLFGVGPDGTGMSRYSEHYYNPVTGEGEGPKSSAYYFAYLVRENTAQRSTNAEVGGKAAAWSAHYLADMFVPYHVTGMSRQMAERIWKEQRAKHPGVISLGFSVIGSSKLSYAAPFKEGNINFNTELSRFISKTDPSEADWFDPWYYNGNTDPLMINTSSHVAWEAFPNYSLKRGVLGSIKGYIVTGVAPAIITGITDTAGESFVEYHHRAGQGLPGYSLDWKNAVPDMTNPQDGQAEQVRKLAVLSATETRNQLEKYFEDPTPALAKAIQTVYTMWRSSFSGLRPTMEYRPDGPNAYKVTGKIANHANGDVNSLKVRLTAIDCTISDQPEKAFGLLSAGMKGDTTPWRVTTSDKLCRIKMEVIGNYAIPDLQYAAVEQSFFPQQVEEPVKPKPAKPAITEKPSLPSVVDKQVGGAWVLVDTKKTDYELKPVKTVSGSDATMTTSYNDSSFSVSAKADMYKYGDRKNGIHSTWTWDIKGSWDQPPLSILPGSTLKLGCSIDRRNSKEVSKEGPTSIKISMSGHQGRVYGWDTHECNADTKPTGSRSYDIFEESQMCFRRGDCTDRDFTMTIRIEAKVLGHLRFGFDSPWAQATRVYTYRYQKGAGERAQP